MKRLATLAALAALAGSLLVAGGVVFLAPILNPGLDSLDTGVGVVLFGGLALYWILGAIIVLRADAHTIGWLFAISAAMLATVFGCWAGSGVAALADAGGPRQAWFVLAGSLLFPPAITLGRCPHPTQSERGRRRAAGNRRDQRGNAAPRGRDPLVVAGSTLLFAALFQPVRRRVQAVVDRRFNRARYDAERTVERFSGRLRDELDLSTLAGELQRTTSAAVQPTVSAVWLRQGVPR